MSQKRHAVDQIITKLRRADVLLGKGMKVPEVCKQLEIAEQTYYRWRQKYGGMQPEMAKQFKALEKENARLKRWWPNRFSTWIFCRKLQRETGKPRTTTANGRRSASSFGASESVGASSLPCARSAPRYTALSGTSAT